MKMVAGALSFIFLFCNVLFAHQPQVSLWKERKQARETQLASLPLQSILPFNNSLKKSSSNISSKTLQLPQKISRKYGSVSSRLPQGLFKHLNIKEAKTFGATPAIVLIEDVHQNLEAQTHISEALKSFGQIPWEKEVAIGLEGAAGGFVYDLYKQFPDRAAATLIADDFFKRGEISGPAHAGFTSYPIEGGAQLKFIGVENPELYTKNVEAYRASSKQKESAVKEISAQAAQIEESKKKIFSPELLAFDAQVKAYREGQFAFPDYVRFLAQQSNEVPLATEVFLEAYRMEKALNFAQVEMERRRILEKLVGKLSQEDLDGLLNTGLAYEEGHLTFADYYGHLKDLCEKSGINLSASPKFNDYIRYVLMVDGIDSNRLFKDVMALEKEIYSKLAQSDKERALVALDKKNHLEKKLVNFELTTEEWTEYQKSVPSAQSLVPSIKNNLGTKHQALSTSLMPFENFYQVAEARNLSMIENLGTRHQALGTSLSVLVSGGFHTQGLTELLKERQQSYIVLSPKMTKVDAASGSAYLSVFDREKTSLDKIFSGEKLFLVKTPTGAGPDATMANMVGGVVASEINDPKTLASTLQIGESILSPVVKKIEVVAQKANRAIIETRTATRTVRFYVNQKLGLLDRFRFSPKAALATPSGEIIVASPNLFMSGKFGEWFAEHNLNTSVDLLGLPSGIRKTLNFNGLRTVRQVLSLTRAELDAFFRSSEINTLRKKLRSAYFNSMPDSQLWSPIFAGFFAARMAGIETGYFVLAAIPLMFIWGLIYVWTHPYLKHDQRIQDLAYDWTIHSPSVRIWRVSETAPVLGGERIKVHQYSNVEQGELIRINVFVVKKVSPVEIIPFLLKSTYISDGQKKYLQGYLKYLELGERTTHYSSRVNSPAIVGVLAVLLAATTDEQIAQAIRYGLLIFIGLLAGAFVKFAFSEEIKYGINILFGNENGIQDYLIKKAIQGDYRMTAPQGIIVRVPAGDERLRKALVQITDTVEHNYEEGTAIAYPLFTVLAKKDTPSVVIRDALLAHPNLPAESKPRLKALQFISRKDRKEEAKLQKKWRKQILDAVWNEAFGLPVSIHRLPMGHELLKGQAVNLKFNVRIYVDSDGTSESKNLIIYVANTVHPVDIIFALLESDEIDPKIKTSLNALLSEKTGIKPSYASSAQNITSMPAAQTPTQSDSANMWDVLFKGPGSNQNPQRSMASSWPTSGRANMPVVAAMSALALLALNPFQELDGEHQVGMWVVIGIGILAAVVALIIEINDRKPKEFPDQWDALIRQTIWDGQKNGVGIEIKRFPVNDPKLKGKLVEVEERNDWLQSSDGDSFDPTVMHIYVNSRFDGRLLISELLKTSYFKEGTRKALTELSQQISRGKGVRLNIPVLAMTAAAVLAAAQAAPNNDGFKVFVGLLLSVSILVLVALLITFIGMISEIRRRNRLLDEADRNESKGGGFDTGGSFDSSSFGSGSFDGGSKWSLYKGSEKYEKFQAPGIESAALAFFSSISILIVALIVGVPLDMANAHSWVQHPVTFFFTSILVSGPVFFKLHKIYRPDLTVSLADMLQAWFLSWGGGLIAFSLVAMKYPNAHAAIAVAVMGFVFGLVHAVMHYNNNINGPPSGRWSVARRFEINIGPDLFRKFATDMLPWLMENKAIDFPSYALQRDAPVEEFLEILDPRESGRMAELLKRKLKVNTVLDYSKIEIYKLLSLMDEVGSPFSPAFVRRSRQVLIENGYPIPDYFDPRTSIMEAAFIADINDNDLAKAYKALQKDRILTIAHFKEAFPDSDSIENKSTEIMKIFSTVRTIGYFSQETAGEGSAVEVRLTNIKDLKRKPLSLMPFGKSTRNLVLFLGLDWVVDFLNRSPDDFRKFDLPGTDRSLLSDFWEKIETASKNPGQLLLVKSLKDTGDIQELTPMTAIQILDSPIGEISPRLKELTRRQTFKIETLRQLVLLPLNRLDQFFYADGIREINANLKLLRLKLRLSKDEVTAWKVYVETGKFRPWSLYPGSEKYQKRVAPGWESPALAVLTSLAVLLTLWLSDIPFMDPAAQWMPRISIFILYSLFFSVPVFGFAHHIFHRNRENDWLGYMGAWFVSIIAAMAAVDQIAVVRLNANVISAVNIGGLAFAAVHTFVHYFNNHLARTPDQYWSLLPDSPRGFRSVTLQIRPGKYESFLRSILPLLGKEGYFDGLPAVLAQPDTTIEDFLSFYYPSVLGVRIGQELRALGIDTVQKFAEEGTSSRLLYAMTPTKYEDRLMAYSIVPKAKRDLAQYGYRVWDMAAPTASAMDFVMAMEWQGNIPLTLSHIHAFFVGSGIKTVKDLTRYSNIVFWNPDHRDVIEHGKRIIKEMERLNIVPREQEANSPSEGALHVLINRHQFLKLDVQSLSLSGEVRGLLQFLGIRTVEDLSKWSETDFDRYQLSGDDRNRIREILSRYISNPYLRKAGVVILASLQNGKILPISAVSTDDLLSMSSSEVLPEGSMYNRFLNTDLYSFVKKREKDLGVSPEGLVKINGYLGSIGLRLGMTDADLEVWKNSVIERRDANWSLFKGSENYEKKWAPRWESPALALIGFAPFVFAFWYFRSSPLISGGDMGALTIGVLASMFAFIVNHIISVDLFSYAHRKLRGRYLSRAELGDAFMKSIARSLFAGFIAGGITEGNLVWSTIMAGLVYAFYHTRIHLGHNDESRPDQMWSLVGSQAARPKQYLLSQTVNGAQAEERIKLVTSLISASFNPRWEISKVREKYSDPLKTGHRLTPLINKINTGAESIMIQLMAPLYQITPGLPRPVQEDWTAAQYGSIGNLVIHFSYDRTSVWLEFVPETGNASPLPAEVGQELTASLHDILHSKGVLALPVDPTLQSLSNSVMLSQKVPAFAEAVKELQISIKKLIEIGDKFNEQLSSSLEGNLTSILARETLALSPTGNETGRALTFVWGGSNAGVSLWELSGNGQKKLLGRSEKIKFEDRHLANPRLAMAELAQAAKDLLATQTLEPEEVIPAGLEFAFDHTLNSLSDARITDKTSVKGWQFNSFADPEIEKDPNIVAIFNDVLSQAELKNVEVTAIANDTVSPLLAAKYSNRPKISLGGEGLDFEVSGPKRVMIGGILGTGHNLAADFGGEIGIRNLESGNFDGFKDYMSPVDLELDANSNDPGPGVHLLEKLMSGRYVGELVRLHINKIAIKSGFFADWLDSDIWDTPYALKAELLSIAESDKTLTLTELDEVLKANGVASTVAERVMFKVIGNEVMRRSAKFLGMEIRALIKRSGDTKSRIVVPMEGSVHSDYPGYAQVVKKTLQDLMGFDNAGRVEIVDYSENVGLGSSILALLASGYKSSKLNSPAIVGTILFILTIMPLGQVDGDWTSTGHAILDWLLVGIFFLGLGAIAVMWIWPKLNKQKTDSSDNDPNLEEIVDLTRKFDREILQTTAAPSNREVFERLIGLARPQKLLTVDSVLGQGYVEQARKAWNRSSSLIALATLAAFLIGAVNHVEGADGTIKFARQRTQEIGKKYVEVVHIGEIPPTADQRTGDKFEEYILQEVARVKSETSDLPEGTELVLAFSGEKGIRQRLMKELNNVDGLAFDIEHLKKDGLVNYHELLSEISETYNDQYPGIRQLAKAQYSNVRLRTVSQTPSIYYGSDWLMSVWTLISLIGGVYISVNLNSVIEGAKLAQKNA